jgi:precorrin-6Y C5,15-methyltransferase (decarboxylating)
VDELFVVGIDRGGCLSEEARRCLERAGVIFASPRLRDVFSQMAGSSGLLGKCRVLEKVDDTVAALRPSRGKAVVLASGDPLFFGIARRLLEEFPPEKVHIVPGVSSVQRAFARARLPWEDALFVSFHGPRRRDWSLDDLPLLCERHGKLAILTGGENTSRDVAARLPRGAVVFVCERLGYPDERVRRSTPAGVRRMTVREPSLLLVLAPPGERPLLGVDEEEMEHERGLITKDEVRAVVLHKLRLPPRGVLWDVGAGSGAVGIEAKRLAPGLRVIAVEKDRARVEGIRRNAERLAAGGLEVIRGEAPRALRSLLSPDRVFIGGAGKGLTEIIEHVSSRMKKGRVVMTAITMESVEEALRALRAQGLAPEACSLSASRMTEVAGRHYMKALNPVFVIEAGR